METEVELDDASPQTRSNLTLWVPLGLVLFWGIWDLSLFRLYDGTSDGPAAGMLVFGPFYGQAVLTALWGAWGPGRAIVRGPVVAGLLVLQALCCTLGFDFVQALFALTIAFLACFLLLLVGRGVTRWSMHHGEEAGVSSENGRYGVRYLLGLTTCVALLAGLAKATDAWGQIESEVVVDPSELAVIALIFVLLSAPVALLFIVTLMTGPHLVRRLIVVILIAVVAILLMTAVVQMWDPRPMLQRLLETAAVFLGAGATVGFSAAMFRRAGYRVGRKLSNPKVAGAGSLEENT